MSKKIVVYDLLLSCPSDVSNSIEIIEKEINRFNNIFGRLNDIIVRSRYWAKDTYPTVDGSPQETINKQIVNDSDMVLAVFWTRFGSPTENYGSGTEEEIERMISAKKQVFLYFLDKPINPSKIDFDQYNRLTEFKEKYKNQGLYFTVENEQTLAHIFRENLELFFDSIVRGKKLKAEKKNREILWVDDRPENNVYERKALEKYGISFHIALSTEQALSIMENNDFSIIISDMVRKEGDREGYVLLDKIRKLNSSIPFIIYGGSKKEEHIKETIRRGGQGCTNNPIELVDLVITNMLK